MNQEKSWKKGSLPSQDQGHPVPLCPIATGNREVTEAAATAPWFREEVEIWPDPTVFRLPPS